MLSDYTFLTDHSYSLRPVDDDQNDLNLNRREGKTKKALKSSKASKKTTPTSNRAVSIDRSSSDKENNSLVSSSASLAATVTASATVNPKKSSTASRTSKKKAINSRLSKRPVMANARSQGGKKQEDKAPSKPSGIKPAPGSITKKKKVNNRSRAKVLNVHVKTTNEFNDVPPSLSIEERVKLRRTVPLSSSSVRVSETKAVSKKQSPSELTKTVKRKTQSVQDDLNEIRRRLSMNSVSKKDKKSQSSTKNAVPVSSVKAKKSFLGSGLDLDNIVLGNRQRRGAQT